MRPLSIIGQSHISTFIIRTKTKKRHIYKTKQDKMVIANPIYDVVFKRLMEDNRIAKFFIGTLLEQTIESVEVKPQEFTFIKDLDQDDPEVEKYIIQKIQERLSINVMRLDFVATIKTETGELKKVLIEIQKAKNQIDLMRFRNYLGEQYKKEDIVNDKKVILPITTIYILGFKLPEIKESCIKIERNYRDLISKKIVDTKSDFIEKLTHDSYIVQVRRITNRYQTKLDKLLSVFEQTDFLDSTEITKEFKHETDIEEVKIITDILHYSGTDPVEKKKLEIEQETWRTVDALTGDLREKAERADKLMQELDDSQRALNESEKTNIELLKQLEEMKRRLGEN